MNDPNFDLAVYTLQYDREAVRNELAEPRVRDELMDALQAGEKDVEAQFIEWAMDDSKELILTLLYPGDRTHKEILDNWMGKWVDSEIREHGWQAVANLYGLNEE